MFCIRNKTIIQGFKIQNYKSRLENQLDSGKKFFGVKQPYDALTLYLTPSTTIQFQRFNKPLMFILCPSLSLFCDGIGFSYLIFVIRAHLYYVADKNDAINAIYDICTESAMPKNG